MQAIGWNGLCPFGELSKGGKGPMTKHKTRANRMHRQVVHTCECPTCRQYPSGRIAREHRAINRLIAAADERTRRLTAGLLARLHGRGGISLLARISGL